jgi:hypothetical protein
MSLLSSLRLLRVGLALAVAFWMAGAGCMLGCQNMASAATLHSTNASGEQAVISGDACASAQSHHCCEKHRAHSASDPATETNTASEAVELIGNSAPSMVDCPLALNATAAISKPGSDHSTVAVVTTNASHPIPHLSSQGRALSHPLLLPNRGHTYLRCCVFLI